MIIPKAFGSTRNGNKLLSYRLTMRSMQQQQQQRLRHAYKIVNDRSIDRDEIPVLCFEAQEIGRSCTVKIDRAPKTSAPRPSYSVTKYGKGDETIENNWFSLSYAVRHERPRAENMAGQIRCWKDRPNKKVKVSLRYT